LDSNGVAVVVEHVGKKVDGISIIGNRGIADYSKGIKLVAKGSFTNDKLCGVGSVKAVDAICPCDSVLDLGHGNSAISVMEEASGSENILGNVLKSSNDILIATFRSSTHVPCFMEDLLVFW
jgi:hypothetical protein